MSYVNAHLANVVDNNLAHQYFLSLPTIRKRAQSMIKKLTTLLSNFKRKHIGTARVCRCSKMHPFMLL